MSIQKGGAYFSGVQWGGESILPKRQYIAMIYPFKFYDISFKVLTHVFTTKSTSPQKVVFFTSPWKNGIELLTNSITTSQNQQ